MFVSIIFLSDVLAQNISLKIHLLFMRYCLTHFCAEGQDQDSEKNLLWLHL